SSFSCGFTIRLRYFYLGQSSLKSMQIRTAARKALRFRRTHPHGQLEAGTAAEGCFCGPPDITCAGLERVGQSTMTAVLRLIMLQANQPSTSTPRAAKLSAGECGPNAIAKPTSTPGKTCIGAH